MYTYDDLRFSYIEPVSTGCGLANHTIYRTATMRIIEDAMPEKSFMYL
jgi:hypothetical protein